METAAKGLLLVLVDPAPAMEEELNDWYDTFVSHLWATGPATPPFMT